MRHDIDIDNLDIDILDCITTNERKSFLEPSEDERQQEVDGHLGTG